MEKESRDSKEPVGLFLPAFQEVFVWPYSPGAEKQAREVARAYVAALKAFGWAEEVPLPGTNNTNTK